MRRLALPLLFFAAVGVGRLLPRGPAEAEAAEPAPVATGFASVIERAEASVVAIQTHLERPRAVTGSDDASPLGSPGGGFVYSSDGLIVTSRHLVEGARTIYVDLRGRGRLEARVLAVDAEMDVALLRVDAQGLVPLPIGDPHALRVGHWVLAVGNPYNLARSWSVGIVSGLHRDPQVFEGYEDFIQTDAAINVGNSGGPLLDSAGRVVGVSTAILSRSEGNQGIGFAFPIDVVVQAVEQLRTTGRVRRSSLGVVVRTLPGEVGLQVVDFPEDSPARRAGLREGDVILKVDGTRVPTKAALQRAVWAKRAGDSVQLEVWRDGRVSVVTTRVRDADSP
jgi:serine protease Do